MPSIIEYFLRLTNKIGELLFMREIKRLRALNELLLLRMDRYWSWGIGQNNEDFIKNIELTKEEIEMCALLNMTRAQYAWNKEKIRLEAMNGGGRHFAGTGLL